MYTVHTFPYSIYLSFIYENFLLYVLDFQVTMQRGKKTKTFSRKESDILFAHMWSSRDLRGPKTWSEKPRDLVRNVGRGLVDLVSIFMSVRARVHNYISDMSGQILFVLGTTTTHDGTHMHAIFFSKSDPRWPTGGQFSCKKTRC